MTSEDVPTRGDARGGGRIESIELIDDFIRYSVIDTTGSEHCVGGRLHGFFDEEEIAVIVRAAH